MIHPDTMRRIDRWGGIPLCFLLSAVNRLIPSSAGSAARDPRRILIVQLSEMGAAVLARPALQHLQQQYPDAELFYLVFEEIKPGLELLDIVPPDRILTLATGSLPVLLRDTIRVIRLLRKKHVDAVLDFELFARCSTVLSRLSGAPVRVGFDNFAAEGLYRGRLLTHRVQYNCYRHISLNFLALCRALAADRTGAPLVKERITALDTERFLLAPDQQTTLAVREKLKQAGASIGPGSRVIILNPNASGMLPIRKWPLENYIRLARMLLKNQHWHVVLTGAAADLPEVTALHNAVNHDRCISLADRTTLKELVALYTISDVLVSNDSGPPHFAALTGIRIVVLFGPETPRLYAPLSPNLDVVYQGLACSPCVSAFNHRATPCTDNRCLKLIAPEDIYRRVASYLDGCAEG